MFGLCVFLFFDFYGNRASAYCVSARFARKTGRRGFHKKDGTNETPPHDREAQEDGSILVRVMKSHIRIGTFEYASYFGSTDDLRKLTSYSINRLYPEIKKHKNPRATFSPRLALVPFCCPRRTAAKMAQRPPPLTMCSVFPGRAANHFS